MFAYTMNPLEAVVVYGSLLLVSVSLLIWWLGGFKPEPRRIPKYVIKRGQEDPRVVIEWLRTPKGGHVVRADNGQVYWFDTTERLGDYTLVFEKEA